MKSEETWHNCLLLLHVAPPFMFTVTSFQAMPINSLAVPSPSLGVYQYNKLDMRVQRMCCIFGIISPVVKQLPTSGKKQWSILGFVQLCCSFEAYHKSKSYEINQKLSHQKLRLSICSWTLAVLFMFGLKFALKLELSFSSTQLFVSSSFVACVLVQIGCDKLGPVDCDRNLRHKTFN